MVYTLYSGFLSELYLKLFKCLRFLYYNNINNHPKPSCFPGGDSKTLMLVQISPSEHDIGETLSSLNFATRVRGVELGPAKKQIDMGELQKFKTMVSLQIVTDILLH
jgi:hypothetical protein